MFVNWYPERKSGAVWDFARGVFNFNFGACDDLGLTFDENDGS